MLHPATGNQRPYFERCPRSRAGLGAPMTEQFQWLWSATVAGFWQRTSVFGISTTIFVRRMLFWSPVTAGLLLSGSVGPGHIGVVAGLAGFPFLVAAYLFILGIVSPAALRTAAFLVERPVFFGSWLRPCMRLADLLWRLEAGPNYGAEQSRQSLRSLDRALYDASRELDPRPLPPGHVWMPVLPAWSEGTGPVWHSAIVAALVAASAKAFVLLSAGAPM